MRIRKATKKDTLNLIKLFRAMVKHHEGIYTKEDRFYNKHAGNVRNLWRKFIQKSITSKDSLVLIAYDEKEPIAYCIGLSRNNIPVYALKKYGFISDLYVGKEYRRIGVGKELLKQQKAFFREKKVKFLSLEVNHNNYPSIEFYKRCGFKEYHKTMRMRI